MGTAPRNAAALYRRALVWAGYDYLRHGLRISLWVRWFAVIAWLAQLHNQVSFAQPAYVAHGLFAVALLALNGYVHYRIETRQPVTWRWAFALSAMDVVVLTGGLAISSGYGNTFFALYFVGLAMFAAVCTSFRANLAGATAVAALFVALSSTTRPDGGFELMGREDLLTNVVAMYAVVGAVSLVSRFEQIRSNFDRVRRRRAMDRERELLRERVELSQAIHDTIAQSAFTIGLGLEDRNRSGKRAKGREPRRAGRQIGSHARAVEVNDVGVAASHRRGSHLRRAGVEPGAAVPFLDVFCHHLDSHGTGPVRHRTAAAHGCQRASFLHSSQRHDQRASPRSSRENHHTAQL